MTTRINNIYPQPVKETDMYDKDKFEDRYCILEEDEYVGRVSPHIEEMAAITTWMRHMEGIHHTNRLSMDAEYRTYCKQIERDCKASQQETDLEWCTCGAKHTGETHSEWCDIRYGEQIPF